MHADMGVAQHKQQHQQVSKYAHILTCFTDDRIVDHSLSQDILVRPVGGCAGALADLSMEHHALQSLHQMLEVWIDDNPFIGISYSAQVVRRRVLKLFSFAVRHVMNYNHKLTHVKYKELRGFGVLGFWGDRKSVV